MIYDQFCDFAAILFFAAIFLSKMCKLQKVNMNYHAKSGASSFENLVSYDQFYDLAAVLFFGGYFVFGVHFLGNSFVLPPFYEHPPRGVFGTFPNSHNFQARSSRFCMVLHIDLLQITNFGKQNGCQIKKLIIAHSFFKLESLNCAW